MINSELWKNGWAVLDPDERKQAFLTLLVVIVSAFATAIMIGSIAPFLSVLSDPSKIEEVPTLQWVYNVLGSSSTYTFLITLGIFSLAVITISTVLQIARAYTVSRFAMMRSHSLSVKLMDAYLRQPYEYFLDQHTGELGTKILSESQQVVMQFYRPALNLIASAFTIAAIVCLLLWINWIVSIACFIVIGGIYASIFYISRRTLEHLGALRLSANKLRYRIASEALGGIKDIKLIGREASYLRRFDEPSLSMARTQVIAQVVGETPSYLLQGVTFSGMIIMTIALLNPAGIDSGGALGEILPVLGVFAFAGQRLMPELQRAYQATTQLQYGKAAIENLHHDLTSSVGHSRLPALPPKPIGLKSHICLSEVSYTYPNAKRPGLDEINLTINAGEKIGIVGTTGAGKTTLSDLLLGLISPTKGRILVDGTVIDQKNVRAWQQTVGYVPQDIFLTDATIKENIALGIPANEIDMTRIKEVCRISNLEDLILDKYDGDYNKIVGERGVKLSGGQRQRIGIARALYHDAKFFVFDEATSALDNSTEREVMSAINALPGDKTIMMIAHRLSTVKECDRIVVLSEGRVEGVGTWDQLIENSAIFRKIATQ